MLHIVCRWHLASILVAAVLAASAVAQPAAPKPPDKFRALIRYRIIAPRDLHVRLYDEMIDHLKGLGFEFTPPLEKHPRTDREDPTKDRLAGLISSSKALDILQSPSIASVLLIPEKMALPDAPEKTVRVKIELTSGLASDRQRELADQTRVLLQQAIPGGVRELVGYDHRGYTGRPFSRIVGAVAVGQLELLLKDLRRLPAGWFATDLESTELPAPLRDVSPILVTEVLDAEPLVEAAVDIRETEFLEKITPQLWKLLPAKKAGGTTTLQRVEVILAATPRPGDKLWRQHLERAAPSFFIEGELGPYVTGLIRLEEVRSLAAVPVVSGIRLPHVTQPDVESAVAPKGDNVRALKQSGLRELHQRGFRGQGIRLAIIDTDFRAWQDFVARRLLPPRTKLVDLTTEKDPEIYPQPMPGDPKQVGHGTLCAVAAALAAPEVELVLLRIDAPSPLRLQQVIRHLRGDTSSVHLDLRRAELESAGATLRRQREEILRERDIILRDFTDETEVMRNFAFLGAARGWIFSKREWSLQRLAWQEKEEATFKARERRFADFFREIVGLRGIPLAMAPFVWNDTYPLGGASPWTRWFDSQPLRAPLWFQPVGNARGQAWMGLYQDADSNGVMEFVSPRAPIPAGRWSHELNFLAWRPHLGEKTLDLPAKAGLRVSLQWREPHDPAYFVRPGEEDAYRQPLADLRLVVLRQRDPSGKTESSDFFDVVARSPLSPQRLDNVPSASVYEQSVDFTVERPGRYAVRIERPREREWFLRADPRLGRLTFTLLQGLQSTGVRPAGAPALPELEKQWELWPRLFVQTVDDGLRLQGRPVWHDYSTDFGTLGTPADARQVIAVGGADFADQPQPYTTIGAPANLELYRQPAVLAYDELQLGAGGAHGSSVAASFVAGMGAALLSSGMTAADLYQFFQNQKGRALRVSPR